VNIINYVDILAEEVVFHENYLIEENRKPLKLISQYKLKGNYSQKIEKITEFYEEISKDILEYDLTDNKEKENFESENKNIESIKDNNLKKNKSVFLKWTENSCRYDTFFLFIAFL